MVIKGWRMPFSGAESVSVEETINSINTTLKSLGGKYGTYSCKNVSWDDAQRGTVSGSLSCWGGNITDTRLFEKQGRILYTVRSDNWNERLGSVSSDKVAVLTGNHEANSNLQPVTLQHFLKNIGQYGQYANLKGNSDLSLDENDTQISIRFQTTFLPVEDKDKATMEFATEAYNYNTMDDSDPRNLVLLCTTQGTAVQQDGIGAKKLYHHAVDNSGDCHRYWLEAERSRHAVGKEQKETREEALEAASRGKATSSVIGIEAMGTRFNILMTVQIPLKQKPKKRSRGFGGGMKTMQCSFPSDGCNMMGGMMEAGYMIDNVDDILDDLDCQVESFQQQSCTLQEQAFTFSKSAPKRRSKSSSNRRKGVSNAARVSRGTEVDVWNGLTVKEPERDTSQHITITCVIYNTCAGGVPTDEDVRAAVDDMENLYNACAGNGKLSDSSFNFMKKDLTYTETQKIASKISHQPYKPQHGLVQNANVFPS